MSPYAILVGLLVLAWAGGALVRPTQRRPFGLSSGTEFLLAGMLVGPLGVGAVGRSTLEDLAPLTLVAASWLALVAGSDLGFAGRRRVPLPRLALGLVLSLAIFAACAALAWWLAPRVMPVDDDERRLLALGLGCAGSETARAAMVWGVDRLSTLGPLHDALVDLTEADHVVALIGLAVLFALGPQPPEATLHGAPLIALGVTLSLGAAAGALAAILTRVEARPTERWGILLGTALMAIGFSTLLGLAAPAALAAMGVTLNLLARDSAVLRGMLTSTTRPVLLPVVALAGAHLDLRDGQLLWFAAALVPAVRLAIKLPVIAALRHHLASPAALTPWAGAALMASGPITVCVGLVAAARFPGPVGRLVLAACLSTIIVGELIGPTALRRELRHAGELPPAGSGTPEGAQPEIR